MQTDPILEEIYRIRQKLMDEAGGDLHEAIRRARSRRDPLRRVIKGEPRRPDGWIDVASGGTAQGIERAR